MDFSLIETLRWDPGAGFCCLEQHLRRLRCSANVLGFRQPGEELTAVLNDAASGDAPLRVKLTLAFCGQLSVSVTPFVGTPNAQAWKIRIAKTRLNSGDALCRHKTSHRRLYEAARAEFSGDEADEVLLLNERGELCEGTMTNVFVEDDNGRLVTPALSSGLLPGILRADLLRRRKARSEVMRPEDIGLRKFFVGNSLRGLIRAELASGN